MSRKASGKSNRTGISVVEQSRRFPDDMTARSMVPCAPPSSCADRAAERVCRPVGSP